MIADPSAEQLLALTVAEARTLFEGDAEANARRFRELASVWHPDHNRAREATAVFAHLVDLYEGARTKGAEANERVFRTTDARSFRVRWRARRVGDLGELLIGDRVIAHAVPAELDRLAAMADAWQPSFADEAMRAEMALSLPRRLATLVTAEGYVFVEHKEPGTVLLQDLMRLGPVDPCQAAWIATRLVNLACWLQWVGIAHGAIGPDTLLVSPETHSLALTGPFLCAGSFGAEPAVLPERTLACAPRYGVPGAVLDQRLDPELVRLTVRELLGDAAGTRLASDPAFPKPFANWLLMPTTEGARSDFPAWEAARDASFGPRRFVRWDVDVAALMAA